jgi:branched-chain amino acid transport system permease protein
MSLFLQRLFDAFENGAIYASMALALAIIYKSTGHLNFAQGEMAMFSAFLCYVLAAEQGWPVWFAVAVAVLVAATFGAGVERVLVRPFEKKNPLSVVIITLGLFLILNSVARDIWFGEPRQYVSPFPEKGDGGIDIGGATLFWSTITYWAAIGVAFGGLMLLLRRTKIGLAFRAVSSNRESAQFVGIGVGRTLMVGWALAAAMGALAGIIAASRQGTIDANLMLPLLIYAFAAVTLGGFDSIGGAIVGGIVVAFVETMAGGYISRIGGSLAQTTALSLIIVVLLFRPTGLFGSRKVERV